MIGSDGIVSCHHTADGQPVGVQRRVNIANTCNSDFIGGAGAFYSTNASDVNGMIAAFVNAVHGGNADIIFHVMIPFC